MIINIITTVLYYGLVAQKPVIRIKYKVDNSLWEFINTDADEALEIDSFLFEEKIMEMLYNEQKKMQFHQKASRYLFENHCYEDLRVGERLLHITHDILN
jgi:hypothetical protein